MKENKGFWQRLEENHPVLYEVIQWGILALAVVSIALNSFAIMLRLAIQKSC